MRLAFGPLWKISIGAGAVPVLRFECFRLSVLLFEVLIGGVRWPSCSFFHPFVNIHDFLVTCSWVSGATHI